MSRHFILSDNDVLEKKPIAGSALQSPLVFSVLLAALFFMPSAQAASCKLPKSYYKNVSCTSTRGYFLAIKDFGEPVALIDSKGKVITDLTSYQKVDANKIAGGLLPILRNGRVGYISLQGREVIPTIYDMLNSSKNWARPVSEGLIVVKKAGEFGVINTDNKTIVPFSAAISDIDNYQNGRARIRKNKAISWLDKNGNPINDAKEASSNSSNRNAVSKDATSSGVGNQNANTQVAPVNTPTAQSGTENNTFPLVEPIVPDTARFTSLQPRQQDGKWGFVDNNNVIMITYSFDEVRPFSEGLAGIRIDNKWGFLNLGGELIIPLVFDNNSVLPSDSPAETPSFVFNDGKAWVNNLSNGSKMCINKDGVYVGCE